jgi:DNA topoisomerase-1
MEKTNLVIVESPAKATTIAKYLNSNSSLKGLGKFIVLSSKGHIRDLKKKELGIDVEHEFEPMYDVLPEKTDVVKSLRDAVKKSTMTYLATDYDREGEGIAMHLQQVLNLKKYKRITFTEITSKALEESVKAPRDIDYDLVDAQETRRLLDRLVGFKLSPLLWKRYTTGGTGLSAGRVQSAVMNIIVTRENEIKAFNSEGYYTFIGKFKLLTKGKKEALEDIKMYHNGAVFKVDSAKDAENTLTSMKGKFEIRDMRQKQARQSPDAPFITSSLQQEAYSKHGFSVKKTMQLAQQLYENGHITYMRTDSYTLSDDFVKSAQTFVNDKYGITHWEGGGAAKKKKSKNSQEAHEAIRPTNVTLIDLPEGGKYINDHKKLYALIWKRTIASLLKHAVYDELAIEIADSSMSKDKAFIATIKRVKFNGYLIVYGVENDEYDFDKFKASVKAIECENINAKQTWSSPPPRYNESSIIKVLESEGIGRPSTYATILAKLLDKTYVIKTDVAGEKKIVTHMIYTPRKPITNEKTNILHGAEKSKLVPTEIGVKINEFLTEKFPYIVDKRFTCSMETDLDQIAEGDKKKLDVLKTFWKQFGGDVAIEVKIKQQKEVVKAKTKSISFGGTDYIIRIAKYGPVIEYMKKDEKKFIGLTHYLKYVKKEYTDIDTNDIKFMKSIPIHIEGENGEKGTIENGPYGMYMKSAKGNHKIPYKHIQTIISNNGHLDKSIVTSIIEYKSKSKK